jgi:hypothetical protein
MLENQIIACNDEIDFWYIEGNIYRSKNNAVLDIYGYPQDRRWECSHKHWMIYKDTVFSWVSQVNCEHNKKMLDNQS